MAIVQMRRVPGDSGLFLINHPPTICQHMHLTQRLAVLNRILDTEQPKKEENKQ